MSIDSCADDFKWISSKWDIWSGVFNPTGRKHILHSHVSQNTIYEATGNVVLILAAGSQLIILGQLLE